MLALKSHLTTAFQTASTQHMPTCVTDLITDYAATDYSIALKEYDLSADGVIPNTARNRQINEMIALAITSPDCDPKIKSTIMAKALSRSAFPYGARRAELCKIIQQVQSRQIQINLDNVDLSGLDLGGLNLRNITARGASFVSTLLNRTNLSGADLTAAVFSKSALRPDMTGAILRNTKLFRTRIIRADLSHADLRGATFNSVIFSGLDFHSALIDDRNLQSAIDAHKQISGLFFFRSTAILNGIYSSGRGFTPRDSSGLHRAFDAIFEDREDIHSDDPVNELY